MDLSRRPLKSAIVARDSLKLALIIIIPGMRNNAANITRVTTEMPSCNVIMRGGQTTHISSALIRISRSLRRSGKAQPDRYGSEAKQDQPLSAIHTAPSNAIIT